jgi:hypothetical protein
LLTDVHAVGRVAPSRYASVEPRGSDIVECARFRRAGERSRVSEGGFRDTALQGRPFESLGPAAIVGIHAMAPAKRWDGRAAARSQS